MAWRTKIPCPWDLRALAPPGVVDSLTVLEVGILARLATIAWEASEPGTIPEEPKVLANRTGANAADILGLLAKLGPAIKAERGRLVLVEVFELHERKAIIVSKRAEAGRMGGRRSKADAQSTSEVREPSGKQMLSKCFPARDHIALKRSESAEEKREPVIGLLSAGARALGEERLSEWRFAQSKAMIEKAIGEWRRQGLSSIPFQKAGELASSVYAEPARVEAILEGANALAASGRLRSPAGYLIAGLGLGPDRTRKLVDVPIWLAEKWERLEAARRKINTSVAAIEAMGRRAIAAKEKLG